MREQKRSSGFCRIFAAAAALVTGVSIAQSTSLATPAEARVVREDRPAIEGAPKTPLYVWRDTERKPRGVALAVHGLVMHGGTYDSMARELAAKGFIVVAPDMRGYGRWMQDKACDSPSSSKNASVEPASELVGKADDETISLSGRTSAKVSLNVMSETPESAVSDEEKSMKIEYGKSYKDLRSLVRALRSQYPSLPFYCIGESLGADMAIRLASDMPKSIDGLVLSSPAIKRRTVYFAPRMFFDAMVLLASPGKEVDLGPYISRWASEDPKVTRSTLEDPLVRKRLSAWDLWKTVRWIKPSIDYAEKLPAQMPILVIQGDQDRMIKTNGVVTLLSHLKSSENKTVKWFNGKGHLLLETRYVEPQAMSTVKDWLETQARQARVYKASIQ